MSKSLFIKGQAQQFEFDRFVASFYKMHKFAPSSAHWLSFVERRSKGSCSTPENVMRVVAHGKAHWPHSMATCRVCKGSKDYHDLIQKHLPHSWAIGAYRSDLPNPRCNLHEPCHRLRIS